MWESTVDGRRLTFHLAGINNQNFIMRDEETGSWWQQVTGEAIYGPLAGKKLTPVAADEVAFDVWRGDHPTTRVLQPDDSAPWRRETEDWEAQTAKFPTPKGATAPDDALPPRAILLGVKADGAATAYPLETVAKERVVVDTVGSTPIALVAADDGESVRVFDRRVDGRTLELFRNQTGGPGLLVDSEGNAWDFSGTCVSGPLAGKTLARVTALRDYWFDWKTYNPTTSVYARP